MSARTVAHRLSRPLPILLALVLLAGGTAAQDTNKTSRPFATQLAEWTRVIDQAQAYLDGSQQVAEETDRRFREAGITIPFPQQVVHLMPSGDA